MPIDIITIYIKEILEDLGEITGEVVTEDVINEIFSKFCLGKQIKNEALKSKIRVKNIFNI